MTEFESDEALILARARRAFEPSAADAQRVLRATHAAIGMPVAAGGGALVAAGKWIVGVVVIAATGVGGYALGYRAGRGEIRAQRDVSSVMAAHSSSTATVTDTSETQAPAASAAPAPALPPSLALAPSARTTATPRTATPSEPGGPHPSPPSDTPSIQVELRALQRSERALRDGQPQVAIRTLTKLDHDVPLGQMMEERAAAWAVARCATKPTAAVAEAFATRHAGSVYTQRVAAACDPAATETTNRANPR